MTSRPAAAQLAEGGRCAIVIPDGVLYRTEQAFSSVRRRLLTEFAGPAVVRLPTGVFPTAPDTRTNLLFFERGTPQPEVIRYYQVLAPVGKRSYSKLNPLTSVVLDAAADWVKDGVADDCAWEVSVDDVRLAGYDLDIPWPGAGVHGDGLDAPERLSEFSHRAETIRELRTSCSRSPRPSRRVSFPPPNL